MDLCYASPARVGTLVVPAVPMSAPKFAERLKKLRDASEVALIDARLPQGAEGSGTNGVDVFDPQTAPNGRIHLHIESQVVAGPLAALADIEPWRQQFLVLGIAESDVDEDAVTRLKQAFPRSLYHAVLLFEDSVRESADTTSARPHVYVVPAKFAALESTLTDVVGELLGKLSVYWLARRVGTFESPKEKLASKTVNASVEKGSRSVSSGRRRHHDSLVIGRTGSISMGSSEREKTRQRGRTSKFLGGLHLLAGRLNDALAELANAAQTLRDCHDLLWYGSSLELLGVTMSLMQLEGVPYTVPPLVVTASLPSGGDAEHPNLDALLPRLTEAVLEIYSQAEDSVPHTVYYDTILRFAAYVATAGAVSAMPPSTEDFHPSRRERKARVDYWIRKIVGSNLKDLPVGAQTRLLGASAALYEVTGLHRKAAFVTSLVISALGASPSMTVNSTTGLGSDQIARVLGAYDCWPRIKAATLRHLVALGERTGDANLQVCSAASLLGMAINYPIDRKEQMALHHLIRDEGDGTPHAYWDPDMLVDVAIKLGPAQTASSRTSTAKQSAGTATTATANNTSPISASIIYNPYERAERGEAGIEAGVPTISRVQLRNPFAVEAHVYELALVDVNGNRVSETVRDVMLPAGSSATRIDVPIIAPAAGRLNVSGCYVQVSGCSGTIFSLRHPYNLRVYPHRPVLMLAQLSLHKGWIMLLEGEKTEFNLTLWNASGITPANSLQFGFNDSTVEPLRQLAAKSDTPKPDLYEYEYFLYSRRAIEMVSPLHTVKPHNSETFEFTLTGKRGLSSAAILVDYGLSENDPNVRRLRIPLQVSVYPSIELERFDLLPSPNSDVDEVLVLLDLRNAWRETMEVVISSRDRDDVRHRVESGASQRFVVTVSWKPPSAEHLAQPIPSLSGRKQFVRDTRTPPEVTTLFWLREELLSCLQGRWISDRQRQGSIELRGIQLSRSMAEILRPEPITLKSNASGDLAVDSLTWITVTVVNKSTEERSGMLCFVPDASSELHMLYIGTLQQPLSVAGGATVNVRLGVVYLACGEFEWTSVFDVIAPHRLQIFQPERLHVHIV